MDEWNRPTNPSYDPYALYGPPPVEQPEPARTNRGLVVALSAALVGTVVLAGGAVTYKLTQPSRDLASWPVGSSLGGTHAAAPASLGSADQVTNTVAPATVNIVSTLGYSGGEAAGTGIVLTSDGIVLTNNHVVRGSTALSVTDVGNGQTYDATVLGYDRSHDVALVKLQGASGLQTAVLGRSADVKVGDDVVGIGNAGGKGGFPTSASGTVSGLGRTIAAHDEADGSSEQLNGLIQVDANIQAGESGGPLANAKGEVVGMDTAGSGGFDLQSGGSVEGFAVPIDTAMAVARQIHVGQGSAKVHLGASAFLGVQIASSAQGDGVHISGVLAGSTAEQAGLVGGDTLVGVGSDSIRTPDALAAEMDSLHPGQQVDLRWVDANGAAQQAQVTLSSGPTG